MVCEQHGHCVTKFHCNSLSSDIRSAVQTNQAITVEPRLFGLLGTTRNSPDNRKYEY